MCFPDLSMRTHIIINKMKRKFTVLVILISFEIFSCRVFQQCHKSIVFDNMSNMDILIGGPILEDVYGNCSIQEIKTVKTGTSSDIFVFRDCVEDMFADENSLLTYYLVVPDSLNIYNTFYSCDSLEYNNAIIEVINISLEDLERTDFTITYP